MNDPIKNLLNGILDGTEPGFEATFPSERVNRAFEELNPEKDANWIDLIAVLSVEMLSGCIQSDDRQDSSYATVQSWCAAAFTNLLDFEMSEIAEGQSPNLNTEN